MEPFGVEDIHVLAALATADEVNLALLVLQQLGAVGRVKRALTAPR